MSGDAVEVFFSYSHKDEALRDQLATHLKLLERQKIIAAWHDRKIVPGSEWAGDIHNYLEQADIILLLISADFLASDYCWDVEIQKALERHEAGTTMVIPVILRPVDWSSAPFARLQALPKNAQAVVTWAPPDLAFMDIAKGIRLRAEELVATRQAQAEQAQKQSALKEYRQKLKTYLADGPLSFIAKENLNDLAQTLGLSQADIAPLDAEETAFRDAYQANLERYGETFRRALDHEYPLSDVTKTHLKDRQIVLNLNDQDVQQIEQSILADWQAQQQQIQRQQEQEAVAQRQREQEAERLRREAEAEQLRQQQAEAERQEQVRQQRETDERLRQEQEASAQRQREQEAERLRKEAEAEQLRQQQAKAERQEQERQQRETAERLRQQQAEAERQERESQRQAVAQRQRQRQAEAAARRQQGQTGISRRRVLQLAGFGGGGLIVAVAAKSLFTAPPNAPPAVTGTSPTDLSAVDVATVRVDETGNIVERNQGQVSAFSEDLGNNIGLDMVAIPAGEFVMGSPPEEEGRGADEGPQRTVTVPSFLMGRFQVTQAQYEAVMGENPSNFKEANRPVDSVSWDNAVAFCKKLTERTGRTYRLPSEAEWEYACRASTTTPFNVGPTITTDLANYRGTSWEINDTTYPGNYGQGPEGIFREETTVVGTFPPNALGLFDMHGNVWEWCQDVWHDSYEGAPTDGSAWMEGGDQAQRVLRGGSWLFDPVLCRSANRLDRSRVNLNLSVGFRVVWVPA